MKGRGPSNILASLFAPLMFAGLHNQSHLLTVVHTSKQYFQIAPLWREFSNGSVFGDRFRRCSVDDSCIRSKTAPFSFENELVWTGP